MDVSRWGEAKEEDRKTERERERKRERGGARERDKAREGGEERERDIEREKRCVSPLYGVRPTDPHLSTAIARNGRQRT